MIKRIVFLVVLCLLFCSSAQAIGWTKLQGTTNSTTGQLTTLAYGSNISVKSLLPVTVGWQGTLTVPTVTDSLGNSFALIRSGFNPNTGNYLALFWAVNSKGAGADSIYISYGSYTAYTGVIIDEFATPAGTAGGDGSAVTVNNVVSGTNSLTSGTFTTLANNDLVYATVTNTLTTGPSVTSGTGFTSSQNIPVNTWIGAGLETTAATEYLVQSTASSSTAGTFTPVAGSNYGVTIAAAFSSVAPSKAGWGF